MAINFHIKTEWIDGRNMLPMICFGYLQVLMFMMLFTVSAVFLLFCREVNIFF